jgi:predicted transcriptional regulator of viral defense system
MAPSIYVLRTYIDGAYMLFSKALEKSLLNSELSVVTFYDYFHQGHLLHTSPSQNAAALTKSPGTWDLQTARKFLKRLQKQKILIPDRDFRSNVFRIAQATHTSSAEEAICIVDPFAYVSHLSAMERYGLTNRSPLALNITTPTHPVWNKLRDQKVFKEIPENEEAPKLLLNRYGIKETVRRRPVSMHMTSHPWTPRKIRGEETRMTSISQTFADMLQEPKLCGGMTHAIEVWTSRASDWIDEITDVIDTMDSQIVKMRAGFILSELMSIEHPILKKWEPLAQRGGSRRLDPEADYAPTYSERWEISINV